MEYVFLNPLVNSDRKLKSMAGKAKFYMRRRAIDDSNGCDLEMRGFLKAS